MPWIAPSGNKYQLVLLDTNTISDLIKPNSLISNGFFRRFKDKPFIPCFTIYSIIEIKRNQNLYDSFITLFSNLPLLFLKPHSIILQEELLKGKLNTESIILRSFIPTNNETKSFRSFFEQFFSNEEINSTINTWKKDEREILEEWVINAQNFIPSKKGPNKKDAYRYVKEASLQSLINQFPSWVEFKLNKNQMPNMEQFPSLKSMLFSQYYRICDTERNLSLNDVTDIRIMAVAPYMDIIITENYQSEVFKKIKRSWTELESIEILTMKDLR